MWYWVLRHTFGRLVRAVWLRSLIGLENIPKSGPVVLAANHASYLDFFLIAAVSRRPVYFFAGEVFFKKWYWALLMKATHQIPVDRLAHNKAQSMQQAKLVLTQGNIFGIFPEGTRSVSGELQSFFTGVGRLAIETGAPVIPIAITGTYQVWPKGRRLPHLWRRCSLYFGEAITPGGFSGADDLTHEVRNRIESMLSNPS